MENNSGQALDYRDTSINAFTLYVGALSCMRHRGEEFYQLQQEGCLAFLILNEIDYITGEYLDKIREAADTVVRERKPEVLNIAAGCQSALLSSDYDLLQEDLEAGLGVRVRIDRNCHLNGYDHHRSRRGEHGGRDGAARRGEHDGRSEEGRRREHGGRSGGARRREHRGRSEEGRGEEHGGRSSAARTGEYSNRSGAARQEEHSGRGNKEKTGGHSGRGNGERTSRHGGRDRRPEDGEHGGRHSREGRSTQNRRGGRE